MTDITILTDIRRRIEELEKAVFAHAGLKDEVLRLRQQLATVKAAKKVSKQPHPANAATWEAYRAAYTRRYTTEPIKNVRNNALIKQLVERVGHTNAVELVKFYVEDQTAFYVRGYHNLGFLIKDCESLLVKLQTGKTITYQQAKKAEETQANVRVQAEYLRKKHGIR